MTAVELGFCPVCRTSAPMPCQSVGALRYGTCPVCEARFLDPAQRLGRAAEYAHYLHHENDPDDPRYRRFLGKLSDPLLALLAPGSRGLDYGCGPGPALAAVLAEAGHRVALFDPFFYPDPAPLSARYDFVTCTEVAEHFHDPAAEFDRMAALLKPGGWLAIMTCFATDDAKFANWHYRKDPTHVVFYREKTLQHIAASRGMSFCSPVKDVALMRRAIASVG